LHLPRVYFDLRKEFEAQQKQVTAWTPAIGLIAALGSSLDRIHRIGGIKTLRSNSEILAESLRSALNSWKIPLFSKNPGNSVTAFVINQPDDFIEHLKHKENLVVASGQGSLQGQIIRIGHLGFISPDDMVFTIEALERAFIKFNIEA
jgi:aspartate aminotransferase-like enzyme